MTARAIFPLEQWLTATNQNSTSANDNALSLEAWSGPAIGFLDAAPTGTPVDHDQYVIRTAWGSNGVGNILIYLGGTWFEFAGVNGMVKSIAGRQHTRSAGVWIITPLWVPAPSSSTDTGTKGTIAYDSSNFYVCTTDNVWARAALATW